MYYKIIIQDDSIIIDFLTETSGNEDNARQAKLLKQDLDKILDENKSKKYNLLVDITLLKTDYTLPSESRKIYSRIAKSKQIRKIAVSGKGILIKTVVSFIVNVSGKKDTFKWFENREEAIKWFKQT